MKLTFSQLKAMDEQKLRMLDDANRDRLSKSRPGPVSASMLKPVSPTAKVAANLDGVKITRVEPGVARGVEKPEMRAKGEHGTESRLPSKMTRKEMLLELERVKHSIPVALYTAARRKLGAK